MNLAVSPCPSSEAHIIKNLYPLYLHDLSEFVVDMRCLPNRHGVIGEADDVMSPASGSSQNGWWEQPTSCFPYLFRADGYPIGFALVATAPHVSSAATYAMYEFFVIRSYRRTGISEEAALHVFSQFAGKWEAGVLRDNAVAIAFWRRVIGRHTAGIFCELPNDDGFPLGPVFRFTSPGTKV